MYRKPSGGTGFSFGRLVTNAFPNFANDNSEQDADLTATEQDGLWMHQVVGADACGRPPMTLDAESALRAGVTTSEKLSARIHKALVNNGILDPQSPLGIDTTRITPKFAHQLAFISVAGQRKVVGMLFFWEQEALRWRLLDQEEAELKAAMEESDATDDQRRELQTRLESVRMRRAMKPSQRVGEGESAAQQPEEPPAYS